MLLHFEDHLDRMIWFRSVVYADCTPVMSTPCMDNIEQPQKHIQHLHTLHKDSPYITSSTSLGDFAGQAIIRPVVVEDSDRQGQARHLTFMARLPYGTCRAHGCLLRDPLGGGGTVEEGMG